MLEPERPPFRVSVTISVVERPGPVRAAAVGDADCDNIAALPVDGTSETRADEDEEPPAEERILVNNGMNADHRLAASRFISLVSPEEDPDAWRNNAQKMRKTRAGMIFAGC